MNACFLAVLLLATPSALSSTTNSQHPATAPPTTPDLLFLQEQARQGDYGEPTTNTFDCSTCEAYIQCQTSESDLNSQYNSLSQQLESQVRSLQAQADGLRTQLASMQTDYNGCQDSSQSQDQYYQNYMTTEQQELQDCRTGIDTLNSQMSDYNRLQNDNNLITEQNRYLNSLIRNCQNDLDDCNTTNHCDDENQQALDLQERISLRTTECSQTAQDIQSRFTTAVTSLNSRIQTQEDRLASLQAQNSDFDNQYQRLLNLTNDQSQQNQAVEDQLNNLQSQAQGVYNTLTNQTNLS